MKKKEKELFQAAVKEPPAFTHTHAFYLFMGGLLSTQTSALYSHKFTSGSCQVHLQSPAVGSRAAAAALHNLGAGRLPFPDLSAAFKSATTPTLLSVRHFIDISTEENMTCGDDKLE